MTRREKVLADLGIRPDEFVVEIGAGPQPFPGASLIVDKYPFDDLERSGATAGTAPVIQADAERLPLKRGSCDVIFASHVIEHVPHPAQLVEEARRCARKLYLEFPKRSRELLYAWRYHRWLVEVEGSKLVFYENDVPQLHGAFFHEHYDLVLDVWSNERHTLLNAHWFGDPNALELEFSPQTAFEHLVATSPRGGEKRDYRTPYAEDGVGPVAYSWPARVKLAVGSLVPPALLRARRKRMEPRSFTSRPLGDDVLARLLCQACRQESARIERAEGGELACSGCGRRYRAREGVFDFDPAPDLPPGRIE